MFFEEIEPAEIPGLLRQCHVGLVALDPRHRTHNVPGKFLAYMQAGLPVLARVNAGNDLIGMIDIEQVGLAYVGDSAAELAGLATTLCADEPRRRAMSAQALRLAASAFSVTSIARQITTVMATS
jgi:glycosyltransferase involved in cell wall biosynthesis